MKRLNDLFKAIKNAFNRSGFESAEDIFTKAQRGELKQSQANAWAATPQDVEKADKYAEKNGILPYVSAGNLELPLQTPKFSLKTVDKYGIDPTFNIPLNKDGTITVYYHTTKEGAQKANNEKSIKTNGKRIYLTNESSGALVLENKGNFDQDVDGAVVIMRLPPSMLQLDKAYADGRKDFYVPVKQGAFFDEKMRMSAIQVSKNTPILKKGEVFSYSEYSNRITDAITEYDKLSPKEQKLRMDEIRDFMKEQHNIGTLLTENGKLEKTREVGLKNQETDVASMGLGLAAAQKISDKLSTCPNSAICMDLCLGDTAGGNQQYGGVAAKDVNGIEKSAFRAGPRMAQYLKTEGLVIHPEELALMLHDEITKFEKWAKKNEYEPSIRLNVTSDIKPEFWSGLMAAHPDVIFYDYTKLNGDAVAPNHHLTYSSTGFGQIIDGEYVAHKTNNWPAMRGRLDRGFNVAMAFTSKSALPDQVIDNETGKVYKVWDGDNYDARYLDPKQENGVGMVVGLRNKAGTMKEATSTIDTDGFFVDYDPKRDGNFVLVANQGQFKNRVIPIAQEKLSLRKAPDTPSFKRWFGSSTIVNPDGTPKVMYHGTGKDITSFERKTSRGSPIFLTDDPKVAEAFSKDSQAYVLKEFVNNASPELRKEKAYELLNKLKKNEFKGAEFKDRVKKLEQSIDEGKLDDVILLDEEGYQRLFANDLASYGNILPVYVKAERPFDYQNPSHVRRVLAELTNPDDWADQLVTGDWPAIESEEIQEAIKFANFDSFYVKEEGKKNLAVYESSQVKSAIGNQGTYDINEPDIRLSLKKVDQLFDKADDIPESEGVEIIRSNWVGGVSGLGERDSAYDLYRVNGGRKYMSAIQNLVRKELGDNFKGYRLMHTDELEEIQTGAMGSQLASFTLRPDIAQTFANLATYRNVPKDKLKVVEMDLTPEHVWMIGHPAEKELVIDYGQGYNPEAVVEYKPEEKLSLRSTRQPPESKEFKQWFTGSYFTSNGEPLIMYHGTARDITIFRGKQAKAIFITTKPEVAENYAGMGVDYMRTEAYKALTRDEKAELISTVAEQAERDGVISADELIEIQKSLKKRVPDLKNLPTKIEGEIIESLNNLLPTKGNIMPVYVSAKNVFDYANPSDVNLVMDKLTNYSKTLGKKQNPEQYLAAVKGMISRGNWPRIESPEVQEAIKRAGFDGFSVLEAGTKNYAVYNPTAIKSVTGNIGTYGLGEVSTEQAAQFGMTPEQARQAQAEGDIRFSLRKAPDTPEFKRFFSGSKVVNEDGTPKVMYHGTGKDFNEFKMSADKAHRADMPDGYYFTSDIEDANRYAKMGEGSNVMPVYLHIRFPFDIAGKNKISNEMVMQFRDELRKENPNLPFDWVQEKVKLFKEKAQRGGSLPFPNISFSTAAKTRVLKAGGYDGLIDGDRVFVAFEPTQIKSAIGNQGTYDPTNPDIRLSLRAATPAAINDAIDRTTSVREQKGFVERMMEAISPQSWSDFRAKALNRYNAMSVADKKRAKKMGGAALLADQSAESAALMSDLSAGVTASVLGVHDRNGGAPVFRNGITTIDGSIKGPVAIFAPLAKRGDPRIYQMWQFYAGAKRARRYFKDGKEQNYTPSDMAYADQLGQQYPEFKQIFDEWNKFNNALVQYQVDTGVLSKERADEYRKYSDYLPFYRQLEDEATLGPKVFQSISGVKGPKKLKGSEAPIADLMETIVRNVQSGIQAGMKNTAAQRAIKVFEDIGEAVPTHPTDTGPATVYALVNGEKKAYIVADHALYNSMQSLNLPELPFLGFFAGPANLLRNLVTKDPGFMLANMVRDSMSAWVTSGVSMTPVASAVKNFTGALRGTAPEYQALLNAGILGGYEFSQNVEASGKQLSKELAKYGPSTTFGKITKPFTSLWGALEKGTTASDAATRMEVYKNVLAETGNEAEALYRALEVMNFNRKGNSAVIRILTAAVPFLNARMQGLDVLYRAAFGQMATQDAKAIQKSFFIRGATIMAMSMMYWALTHDDDDYMKQEQETRDNYWLIPSLGIKIPIPFEVGVIFKVIPERIAEYAFGNDTGKDFADAMKRNFTNTFAFNPIPQTILPLVEARTDHSFFTGRAILSKGLEGVAPEFQMGPNTSRMAQFFASLTSGMTALPDFLRSPAMIDHIIGGYTGTFGMYAVDAVDAIVSANSDVPKASKRFEQMPVLRRFLLDPEARGNVTAYYDLKNATDEVVRTSNFLERTMNFENFADYSQDTIKMLASADFVKSMDKDMKELNDVIGVIRNSGMSSDEKRDALLSLNQAQNNLTANIKLIKKSLD
jgi:hypothetical protein